MERTDPLAATAIEPVADGMIVGLGTGRAASRAIDALARKVRAVGMSIRCVATSEASRRQAESLGMKVLPLTEAGRVDYLFDGADEVDGRLRMLKGRGGAMTREKAVARASDRRVYLVQRSKVVDHLGFAAPLPIEVHAASLEAVIESLRRLGLAGTVRRTPGGDGYRTDSGNPVIDAPLPTGVDVEALARSLDATPGVVGHGLFLDEADEVLVEESEFGPVTRISRRA